MKTKHFCKDLQIFKSTNCPLEAQVSQVSPTWAEWFERMLGTSKLSISKFWIRIVRLLTGQFSEIWMQKRKSAIASGELLNWNFWKTAHFNDPLSGASKKIPVQKENFYSLNAMESNEAKLSSEMLF